MYVCVSADQYVIIIIYRVTSAATNAYRALLLPYLDFCSTSGLNIGYYALNCFYSKLYKFFYLDSI